VIAQVERIAALLGVPAVSVAADESAVAPRRDHVIAALCRMEARRLEERDEPRGWSAAADGFDAIGRPYPAAYARFRAAAGLLRGRGSRQEAAMALASARSTGARLGARPLLTEIDLLARQARLDLAADAPTGPSAAAGAPDADADEATQATDGADAAARLDLTARELEVLRLLSAGWSNQEIADVLFISRKTASVHASNIYDKLGAANRVEAAAIAHRLGLDAGAPPPPGSTSSVG
jgi:DNA-binding CsgD family transcriptional regulator